MSKKFKLLLLTFCAVFMFSGVAAAQTNFPKSVTAISPNANQANHIILTAFAKIITSHTPIKNFIVQPLGGPMLWLPMMKEGKVQFSIHNAANMIDAFLGQGDFEKMGPQPIRCVGAGHDLIFMFFTTKNTGIKNIEDLKGKATFAYSKGNPMYQQMTEAQLATAGMKPSDLKSTLSFATLDDCVTDMVEGRVEAILYPMPHMGAIITMKEARGDYNFVSLTREQAEKVCEMMPGHFIQDIPANHPRYANTEPINNGVFFQTALWTNVNMDDEVIYAITKAIWDNSKEVENAHPVIPYWSVDAKPGPVGYTVPYHNGSIRYFKEKGIWTDEHQAYQDKMLAEQELRIEAWNAANKK